MKRKKLEQKRKCVACGEIKPKSELIKITKEYTSGNVVVMPDSKIFGRSAYLCYNENCINTAFKKNRINKVLKTGENLDKNVLLGYARLTK